MKPGIYPNLSFREYVAIPALNFSTLKHMRRSPAHARELSLHPKESTTAQVRGSALHAAVLEPDTFRKRFGYGPEPEDGLSVNKDGTLSRRGAQEKRLWAAWELEHPRVEMIPLGDFTACEAIAEKAAAHPVLGAMLRDPKAKRELTVVWESDGAPCKARLDLFATYRGWSYVVDIKSTEGDGFHSAERDSFSRGIATYQYGLQAAWYLDALAAHAPAKRRFVWAAMEFERPYEMALHEPTDELLSESRARIHEYKRQWIECEASGVWPGYGTDIDYIDVPKWAQRGR